MGSTTRTVVTTATFTAFLGLTFKVLSALFDSPKNRDHLESLNFKTILEINEDQFSVWKNKYLLYKEEISSLIPEIKSPETEIQAAYLLKKWCEIRLNENFNPERIKEFDMLKKYCTLDIKNKKIQ